MKKNINLNLVFIITLFSSLVYCSKLQSSVGDWVHDFSQVIYFFTLFVAYYFYVTIILNIRQSELKDQVKPLFIGMNILLIPLEVSSAIAVAYFICLSVFHFNGMFTSLISIIQYAVISVFLLIVPIVITIQIRHMNNVITDDVDKVIISQFF